MKFSTREIFGFFLLLLVGGLSAVAWKGFFAVALSPDVHATLWTLLWFSLLGSVFLLGAVAWSDRPLRLIGASLLFVPSLFFVRTWQHSIIVALCIVLTFLYTCLVQGETEERIRFHFFRTVRTGSFFLVFSLALALSSVYFTTIRAESWEGLASRFSVGEGTAAVVFKAVAYLYPGWHNLAEQGVTVDGFLLSLRNDSSAPQAVPEGSVTPSTDVPEVTPEPPLLGECLKTPSDQGDVTSVAVSEELFLQAGRDQMAQLVGRVVRGDEKMSDVFSLAVQHKLITTLSGQETTRHLSPAIVSVVLAGLLFLTILPVGSILMLLWIIFSLLLFLLALAVGWLRIERVHREQETLVE